MVSASPSARGKRQKERQTVVLHLETGRGVVVVDPAPVVEKPGRVSGGRTGTTGDAPDAADVLADLARIRTLQLAQLGAPFDLEVGFVALGGHDLAEDETSTRGDQQQLALMLIGAFTSSFMSSPPPTGGELLVSACSAIQRVAQERRPFSYTLVSSITQS